MKKDLTALKKSKTWLAEVDSEALRAALSDLDSAFGKFIKRKARGEEPEYPKYRSKHNPRQSYRTRGLSIRVQDKAVRLPNLGFVKCRVSKEVKGRILSATVSRNPAGKYFVSLCCTDVEFDKMSRTGASVGIDLGLIDYVTTSDGIKYLNPKYLEKSEKKLARLNRRLSRKQKGSKRREKARLRFARLHEHVANQRADSLHKLSTELIRKYDVIAIEDLDIAHMMRDSYLSGPISDAAWGEFRRQLKYKAGWYGKRVIPIDRYFPSSQTCSSCGFVNPAVTDGRRKWTCPVCRAEHDRDINAAINILNRAMEKPA